MNDIVHFYSGLLPVSQGNTILPNAPVTMAMDLLVGETEGFAIDATTSIGSVAVKDLTTPNNNRNNASIGNSNLSNVSTSAKMVVSATGFLVTVPAGQIALEWDGTRYGMLIEAQVTNLLLQSQTFSVTWVNANSSDTTNATVAPDNTLSADALVEASDVAQIHSIGQTSTSLTSGTAYTFSCFLKARERTWARLDGATTRFPDNFFCDFDLGRGERGTLGAGATDATIRAIGNGWYRCAITSTCDSTGTNVFSVIIGQSNAVVSYNGNGTSGLFLWGTQLEANPYVTSYIATAAVTVTRDAGNLSCATSSFPYSNATGTVIMWIKPRVLDHVLARRLFQISAGVNEQVNVLFNTADSPDSYGFNVVDGGVSQVTSGTTKTGITSLLGNKIAAAYQLNNSGIVVDGSAEVTDTTCAMAAPTLLTIGNDPITANREFDGYVYQLTYLPRRMTSAQMQARTV